MASVEQTIQQSMLKVAQTVEQQLDAELERLEKLDSDDLESLREQRLKDMKKQAQQQQEWRILVRYSWQHYAASYYQHPLFLLPVDVYCVKFQILMVVTVKMTGFWDTALCSLIEVEQ
jgi:hypothetical protein